MRWYIVGLCLILSLLVQDANAKGRKRFPWKKHPISHNKNGTLKIGTGTAYGPG